jgi:hypothetical protein
LQSTREMFPCTISVLMISKPRSPKRRICLARIIHEAMIFGTQTRRFGVRDHPCSIGYRNQSDIVIISSSGNAR